MKAWFDHIWSMLSKYGTHISKRISDCLRGSKSLHSGCVARITTWTMRIYFRVLNCLNYQQRLYLRLSLTFKIVHEYFSPPNIFCNHELNIMHVMQNLTCIINLLLVPIASFTHL